MIEVHEEDLRKLRDAVSDLILNAKGAAENGKVEVLGVHTKALIVAASALIPLGVWEDRDSPFVWLDGDK